MLCLHGAPTSFISRPDMLTPQGGRRLANSSTSKVDVVQGAPILLQREGTDQGQGLQLKWGELDHPWTSSPEQLALE